MDDAAVRRLGSQLLAFLGVSGVFVAVAPAYTGALQGTGDTRGPLYISLVSQLALPILLCWIAGVAASLGAAHIWLEILLGHMTRAGLSAARFRQGKWRTITVEIE